MFLFGKLLPGDFVFQNGRKGLLGFQWQHFLEKINLEFYIKFQKLDKNIEGHLIVFT
jgi:hypothetical protein